YAASSMTGSSSRWYAISARFSRSRSSAARASTLEMLKQLLRRLDDGVRLLRLEPLARMDPAPGDRDRVQPAGLRGADVERRIPDVSRVVGPRAEPLERELER